MLGNQYSQRELASKISEFSEIQEVWIVAGEWDILLKVRDHSWEEIGSLVIDRIRTLEGVGNTTTIVRFSNIKENY